MNKSRLFTYTPFCFPLAKMSSVKSLNESGSLKCIPSKYYFPSNSSDIILSEAEVIPTIDYSLLNSNNPEQRSNAIQEICHACREWGFFMVINHSVPNKLVNEMLEVSKSFFDLSEEEKGEYREKQNFEPVKYGTSFNTMVDKTLFWRDYLKVSVHPHFNTPHKPTNFRETCQEYSKKIRELASELFKAIALSLGLKENYIHKAMELELGSQLVVVNYYPSCPKPELTIGLPPHTDHGLLTLLNHNGLGGLQVMHNGKWVPINPLPDSIIVNVGDQMEILTNGIYKSVIHRAMVNNEATRISVGTANGPPLDLIVGPAPELVESKTRPSAYREITYREYMLLQRSNELNGKSCLDLIRL